MMVVVVMVKALLLLMVVPLLVVVVLLLVGCMPMWSFPLRWWWSDRHAHSARIEDA